MSSAKRKASDDVFEGTGWSIPDGHVYGLGPNVDRWLGWWTYDDLIHTVREQSKSRGDPPTYVRAIRVLVAHAIEQISDRTSWEGDIRGGHGWEGPRLSAVMPIEQGDDPYAYCVALKQENNGFIYMWSPFPLVWLEAENMENDPVRGDMRVA